MPSPELWRRHEAARFHHAYRRRGSCETGRRPGTAASAHWISRFRDCCRNRGPGEALRAGLRDLGYLEGKNIVIDFRWAEVVDRLRELAAELVRENVDVIFATSSTEVEVARQATTTIPIVFSTHFDPVGTGHVSSLARPGGNITGLAALQTEFSGRHWRC